MFFKFLRISVLSLFSFSCLFFVVSDLGFLRASACFCVLVFFSLFVVVFLCMFLRVLARCRRSITYLQS